MQELHAKKVRFSHGPVLFDSHNVQKSVTQIIYLWPLPSLGQGAARESDLVWGLCGRAWGQCGEVGTVREG